MVVDSVQVEVSGQEIPEEEIRNYIDYLHGKHKGRKLEDLKITVDGDYVDLDYQLNTAPFERIRRITGYLVGDMSHWNNAKRAEEQARVKHI